MNRWVTILIARSYGRQISREAAKLPDPLARLRYLRDRTTEMPAGWLKSRAKIHWKTIATVSGAAVGLTMLLLFWRII